MPLLNYLKIYRDDLGPLLLDGERPIAMASVALAFGATERPARPPRGRRSFLDYVTDPPWPWNDIDWDKVIGGVSVRGEPGTSARRIVDALGDAGGLFCVVTDRRLLLVRHRAQQFSPVFEVPRETITGARRRARASGRGRVVVEFADASAVALNAGLIDSGGANRLVRALSRA